MERSSRPEVRNPILALPAFEGVQALPADTRQALRLLLIDIAADARLRADKCWRTHKAPMALYWKCVAVYSGHIARAIGHPIPAGALIANGTPLDGPGTPVHPSSGLSHDVCRDLAEAGGRVSSDGSFHAQLASAETQHGPV